MVGYEGAVEQTSSGQWMWVIVCDGSEVARGGGYADEGEAIEALHEVLADLSGDCAVGT